MARQIMTPKITAAAAIATPIAIGNQARSASVPVAGWNNGSVADGSLRGRDWRWERSMTVQLILLAGDRHAINAKSWRSNRTAEFQVATNLRNIVEHVAEISGNRYFLDWKRKFAIANP